MLEQSGLREDVQIAVSVEDQDSKPLEEDEIKITLPTPSAKDLDSNHLKKVAK